MSLTERIVHFGSLGILLVVLVFGAGFMFRHRSIWPCDDIIILYQQARFWMRTGEWGRSGQFSRWQVAEGDDRARIVRPDSFLPGYRAVLGYDADLGNYSLRLLDSGGVQIHVWPLDYATIFGESQSVEGLNNPHGLEMLPDGSVVINFGSQGIAIARIDQCGKPIWVRKGRYHHSIDADEAGLLWTWFADEGLNLQYIVALDPETGEEVGRISLEEVAAAAPENALAMGLTDGFAFKPKGKQNRGVGQDVFHPNDVEPLDSDMAVHFPQFKPGDLLISMRNLNFVGVLDPDTLVFKWGAHGPWICQHDPDFIEDGRIDIYNNNFGRGRSGIMWTDPATGESGWRFMTPDSKFYSESQGKMQRLPNGAYLITVRDEGRVIELDADGNLIFEYNNIVTDNLNGRVLNAVWLPEDFYATVPSCGG